MNRRNSTRRAANPERSEGVGTVLRRGIKKYPEGAARSPPPKGHTGRREPLRRLGGRAQADEAKAETDERADARPA